MAILSVRKLNQIICLFIGLLSVFDGGRAINDVDIIHEQQNPSNYDHPAQEKAGKNFVILQTSDAGRRQVTINSGMTWVRETASWEKKDEGFLADYVLREITDGLSLVAAVFDSRGRMRDCHFSHSDDTDVVDEFISDVKKDSNLCARSTVDENIKSNFFEKDINPERVDGSNLLTTIFFPRSTKNDTSALGVEHCKRFYNMLGLPSRFLNTMRLINECEHFRSSSSMPNSNEISTRLDRGNSSLSDVFRPGEHRLSRRSILYPGTVWCGMGNSAKSEYELGKNTFTDRCCRAHDLCPKDMQISSFKTKYHLTNKNMFTLSHCACDKRFHKCLRQVRNPVSYEVGNWYFNILNSQCFVVRQKKQCVEKGWWGKCNREEKRPTAMLRSPQAFPKVLKKNRSAKKRRS